MKFKTLVLAILGSCRWSFTFGSRTFSNDRFVERCRTQCLKDMDGAE